ncbi:MAG: pentapeptide repeat-containing protein [Janthinobacterium lividum]
MEPKTITITSRWSGNTIYTHVATDATVRAAVLAAVGSGADLGGADLRGANLGGADLRGANLRGADLRGANLGGADLRGADLGGANLRDANLGGADLGDANLRDANLRDANLGGADLGDANLRDADLGGADLGGANLRDANLRDANLRDAARLPGFQIPQEGTLTVWKKLRLGVLAKLLIPADAARTATPLGRKCRAAFADVLHIEDAAGTPLTTGRSMHDHDFMYEVGQRVTPASFDADVREECLPGIHFFQTKEEAIAYN